MNVLNPIRFLAHRPLRHSFVVGTNFVARRSFSSPDAAADAVGAIPLEKQQPVRPIFPWRHESKIYSLARFTPGTKEFETTVPFPTNQTLFASMFLGVPLWDIFLFGGWKADLSKNMTYAFLQGLAGIMSNVYKIPRDSALVDNEGAVKFSFPLEDASKDGDDESPPDLNQMLAPPLRELFKSAHESGRDQLRILLETKPKKSLFYGLHVVPLYTRDAIEADPSILKTLYNNGDPDWNELTSIMHTRSLEQLERYGYVETSVAAEVYILCEEKFQVIDAKTGVVLQGQQGAPIAQEVGHVVTFEMTSKIRVRDTFPFGYRIELGNWQIIDIDDLVSTKKWYHV